MDISSNIGAEGGGQTVSGNDSYTKGRAGAGAASLFGRALCTLYQSLVLCIQPQLHPDPVRIPQSRLQISALLGSLTELKSSSSLGAKRLSPSTRQTSQASNNPGSPVSRVGIRTAAHGRPEHETGSSCLTAVERAGHVQPITLCQANRPAFLDARLLSAAFTSLWLASPSPTLAGGSAPPPFNFLHLSLRANSSIQRHSAAFALVSPAAR